MRIHTFDDWLSEEKNTGLTKRQTEFLNRSISGDWMYNEKNGLVDVNGDFHLGSRSKTLQGIKFGVVDGNFMVSQNREFRSLIGCPTEVTGDFHCSSSGITSLEGAPRRVKGKFICYGNKLETLEGGPESVGSIYDCSYNDLRSLKGAPKGRVYEFNCSDNPQLESLEGAPEVITKDFKCTGKNSLKSLIGGPKKVDGFELSSTSLVSLAGAPEEVKGWFGILSDDRRKPIIRTYKGEWNPEGWLKVFTTGSSEAKALIKTLPAFADYMDKEHPEEFEGLSGLIDLGF